MKRSLIPTMIVGTLAVIGISIGVGYSTTASAKASAAAQETVLLGSAIFPGKPDHTGISVTLSGNSVKQTTKTDSGGNFSFSNIPPGTDYQLEASFGADYVAAKNFRVTVKPDGISRTRTLALMARPGTVTGTVTLEGDNSRVGFTFEDLATGARLTQTDPALNGVFTFRGVPAGQRMIRLFKPGFESRLILANVPANGTATLKPVELSSHVGSLDATFTLAGASQHDDIWVILEDNTKSLYYSGITDAKGKVKIEGVLAGRYQLLAKKGDSEELIIDSVVITEGSATTLPSSASTLTRLKGSISGSAELYTISAYNGGNLIHTRKPCYGCFVVTKGGTMTISDKNGRFELSGLSNGEYSVDVSYETCITAQHDSISTQSFSLNDSSPAYNFRSPIPMYESTGTITGVALLKGQTTHANTIVTIEGFTGYVTTTDAHGKYTLLSVPIRNKPLVITFSKANYTPVSLADISASKDAQIVTLDNVMLTPAAK
jgi:hypothetical protein